MNHKPIKKYMVKTSNHQIILHVDDRKLLSAECPNLPLHTISKDGTRRWFKLTPCGTVLHRLDGPAIIHKDGAEEWYKNNKRHRDNDQPAIIRANGDKLWYVKGLLHRDNDKPAVDTQFYQVWCVKGMRHRTNGPAYVSDKELVQCKHGQIISRIYL